MESVAVKSAANMALQQSTDSFLNTEAAKCTLLRENVLVEHLHCGSSVDDIFGHETSGRVSVGMGGTYASRIPTGISPSEAETLCKRGRSNKGLSLVINWIHLFELMHQIVMKRSEEYIRLEAVSTMNVILTRSDAYTEREKFGLIQVFGSISQLLKKEAGLLVQKEAVLTLYLLLNCPKLVVAFCSGCTIVASAGAADNEETTASFKGILEGLVDLILQILVSEIDLEASVYPESVETSRARLSKNEQKPTQFDPITKQMRESEIVDLGRIFKRRVSSYLGE
ncbi:hypothetical protein COLO4_16905 [Corchorus olitorius]|uniref:Uncharacterized protein n=1 Tax=Corchorus olitorius TaxID=93759 RepID=A0A1R3JF89_9ROSI|nr:hypothetical protein COLO4_16905 [Corchorus olitorius]